MRLSELTLKSIRVRDRIVVSGRFLPWRRGKSSWVSIYTEEKSPQLRQQAVLQWVRDSFAVNSEESSSQLLKDLSRTRGALSMSLLAREDLSGLLRSKPAVDENIKSQLKVVDKVIQKWLSYNLSLDTLELRRITFDSSSGSVLEKVARGESVHRVRSLNELKRRLHDGKRCFALFHPTLTDEPLVFIHVGLTTELCQSLSAIDHSKSEHSPTCAIFYSVNSPLSALRGLDMASLLIKEVAGYLSIHFPTIQKFSTLSPIPKFMTWLGQQQSNSPDTDILSFSDKHRQSLQEALSIYQNSRPSMTTSKNTSTSLLPSLYQLLTDDSFLWTRHPEITQLLQEPLLWIGAQYIVHQKVVVGKQSLPLDDVARFHLRNGAIFHAINWMANPSENGLKTSAGMMINYVYDLSRVEQYAHQFQQQPEQFPIGEIVTSILQK